jgi:DNA invertase Pin-like site-specific DNA recombinase
MEKKYISWRRVSTQKQNNSGLGLAAQKEIIRYFIERDSGDWIADYEECYTGTELSGCVELQKAIEHAKQENAVLVIAKTDRFRNTIEALQVYEKMGDGNIMFCDLPHTDKFTLTLFFALAEREALIVSIRTKQALAAKKAKGAKLGGSNEKFRIAMTAKKLSERSHASGRTKSKAKTMERDFVVFAKILRKVFPDATKGNGNDWAWKDINTVGDNKNKVLSLMLNYKELEPTLFASWDFSSDARRLQVRLASQISNMRKTFANCD